MKREKRLPDVLLMSDKTSTLLSYSSKGVGVFVVFDEQRVSFKDEPSAGVWLVI